MSGNFSGPGSPWGRPGEGEADGQQHDPQAWSPPGGHPDGQAPGNAGAPSWGQPAGEEQQQAAPAWGQGSAGGHQPGDQQPPSPNWGQGSAGGHQQQPGDQQPPASTWGQTSAGSQQPGDQQPPSPNWGQGSVGGHQQQPGDQQPPAPAWGQGSAGQTGGWEQTSPQHHDQTAAVPGYEQTTAMPQQGSYGQESYGQGSYGQQSYGHDASGGAGHDPQAQGAFAAGAAGAAGYGGAGQPPHQGDPAGTPGERPRDRGKKPWYKRAAIMIPAIGAVVLLILAAVGIPLGIHLSNVAKGDQLADEFNAALEAHNATWTQEEIDKVASVVVSEALAENADFNSQDSATMSDFETRCEGVATAASTLDTLAASPVPTLAEEDGADASGKYQEALETSNGLADRRAAVETLTGEGAEAMAALSEFCAVYPQYNSLLNTYVVNLTTTLEDALTISNGSDIEFGNGLYITCSNAGGCPDYGTQEGRNAYADAIDATNTAYYGDMAELASTQCFLPELEDVCATMASEYQAASDAYAEAAQSMRTEQPNLTAGERPFPTTFDLLDAADQARASADSAIDSAWQAADPNAAGDTGTGWQARSMKGILAAHETVVTDAVAQLGS